MSMLDQTNDALNEIAANATGQHSTAVCKEAVDELNRRRGFPVPENVDPVSPDAHYIAEASQKAAGRIVKHLWIIFVCLPIVLGILFAILTAK